MMPRSTKKQELLAELEAYFITLLAANAPLAELIRCLATYESVKEHRYSIDRFMVPKSLEWVHQVLPELSEERFRVYTRMNRSSFAYVLSLIEDHAVFHNNSNSSQPSVASQLYLALSRLGNDGSASSFRPLASHWGSSEGHVFNCLTRVITALYDNQNYTIRWPNAERRKNISMINQAKAGFVGAVGSVDGTDIVLWEKPCKLLLILKSWIYLT